MVHCDDRLKHHGGDLPRMVKRGNFDRQGNFDRSGSFVKLATIPIQECLFVASAFMEISN